MNGLAASSVTTLFNRILTRLQNGVPQHWTREEVRFAQLSFGQFGEDLAVVRWVDRLAPLTPIYVDVGAYHPIHHSNTLLLHKRGWKGINVDLNEERIAAFEELRPGDYSVVAAVSDSERQCKVFEYDGGLTDRLGGLDLDNVESVIGRKPSATRLVHTRTLDDIVRSSPWPVGGIGYLNIDCEGHDLHVLKGLDLDAHRPAIITIEAFRDEERHAIRQHLTAFRYAHRETIYNTLLFVRE